MGELRVSTTNGLTISKLFYFFFWAAYASLYPLLALYFKQLGMNAWHAGLLVGVRPLVEFLSAPLWGGLADRFRKGRELLVFSVFAWIVFTLVVPFIRPSTSYCLSVYDNGVDGGGGGSEFVLEGPRRSENNNFLDELLFGGGSGSRSQTTTTVRLNADALPGLAPEVLHEKHNITGFDRREHGDGRLVKPAAGTKVYKSIEVESVFLILLLLIVVGEFFCAPAITLADACTLHYLGDTPELYGRQRMFGSIGWSLSMFLIGIALDLDLRVFPFGHYAHDGHDHDECGQSGVQEKDYNICFITFGVLMTCAIIVATRFRFSYNNSADHQKPPPPAVEKIPVVELPRIKKNCGVVDADAQPKTQQQQQEESSSTAPADHDWLSVMKRLATLHYVSFFFVMWWFGCGIGLIFGFLFWHLQDLGGSPSIFGITTVINNGSEIVAYYFATHLVKAVGHVKVFYIGLLANVARFLYISWLKDPWFILPFEVVQGISHAAVWAAATSYISLGTPIAYKSSTQGILQGVHWGLGRASGALLGGAIIAQIGTELVFRAYGVGCGVIFLVFFTINRMLGVEAAEIQFVEKNNAAAESIGGEEPSTSASAATTAKTPKDILSHPSTSRHNNYGSTTAKSQQ